VAANDLVRRFLQGNCDTLFFLDSDADIPPDFLGRMRDFEPGMEYDALQAFYTSRRWPPEAIWFHDDPLGGDQRCMVVDGALTEPVSLVGLHATLVRREVFQAMLAEQPDIPINEFDWFYYPRHRKGTEDTAFSKEARRLGFRLGATSTIRAAHVGRVSLDWGAYQEYLELSGTRSRQELFEDLCGQVAGFTGEGVEIVRAKALRGSENVRQPYSQANPEGPDALRAFYGSPASGYLYDLIAWNASGGYRRLLEPLAGVKGSRVLVVGAGLGEEVRALAGRNQVDVFELPGALKEFCRGRFQEAQNVCILDGASLMEALNTRGPAWYDLAVAIDVLEHIHPDEFDRAMDALAASLHPGGVLYAHNNFGEQDKYPMHFDNQVLFDAWLVRHNFSKESEMTWRKREDAK